MGAIKTPMHPSKTLDPDVRHPGSVLLARTADALGRRPAGPLGRACRAQVLSDMPDA